LHTNIKIGGLEEKGGGNKEMSCHNKKEEKQETLSDKKQRILGVNLYNENDVREFIKKLKDELCECIVNDHNLLEEECEFCLTIDRLAGEELIK